MHPGTHIGGSAWRQESPTTLDLPAKDRRELYGGRVVRKVTIAVLRYTDRIADDELRDAVDALRHLLDDHFEPAWGIGAKLEAYTFDRSSGDPAPNLPDAWTLLLHGRDLGSELGYHSVAATGLPLARVLVEDPTTGDKLEDWVRIASHELLEMLANPFDSIAVFQHSDPLTPRMYVREVCDPSGKWTFDVCGFKMSDFVHPAWFQPRTKVGDHRFHEADDMHRLEAFELAEYGFLGFYDTALRSWRRLIRLPDTPEPVVQDLQPRPSSGAGSTPAPAVPDLFGPGEWSAMPGPGEWSNLWGAGQGIPEERSWERIFGKGRWKPL